jgi:peptidoglycan/LPS O-acetylase OafA/YrhL
MSKEIKSLTGIRGIAALWVVLLHYVETLNLNKDLYFGKFCSIGIIAVDMFFLLSALVMCLAYSEVFKDKISMSSYVVFMKKRFVRIYPAYFLWVFMFLGLGFLKLEFQVEKIIVNLLLIQNFFSNSTIAGVFWSLSSEWILYLVFPFLYYILQKNENNYIKIGLIIACAIGLYVLPVINNYFIDYHKGFYVAPPSGFIGVVTGFNSIIRCFCSYVIGINIFLLIKDYNTVNYSLGSFLKYCSIIGIFIIAYFGKSAETYVLTLICSILLISVLYIDRKKGDSFFASKAVYFLGQISYSIYLCHMFILFFTSILIKKLFPVQFDLLQPYLVLGSLVLLIPVSYLSYKLIEIKAGEWLKSKLLVKSSEKSNPDKELSSMQGSI